jgi:hypothetical protein
MTGVGGRKHFKTAQQKQAHLQGQLTRCLYEGSNSLWSVVSLSLRRPTGLVDES